MTEEYRNMIRNSKEAFTNLKNSIDSSGCRGRKGTARLSEADANTILQFYIESIAQA